VALRGRRRAALALAAPSLGALVDGCGERNAAVVVRHSKLFGDPAPQRADRWLRARDRSARAALHAAQAGWLRDLVASPRRERVRGFFPRAARERHVA
jgi:hypothetical protein